MRRRQSWAFIILLAFGFSLMPDCIVWHPAWAARKYYPPGFTPVTEPAPSEPTTPAQQQPIQILPRQVIIKTVPVVRAIPQDPLVILLNEHRYFEALRLVDSRIKRSPVNTTLQLTRGNILRDSGRFEQALSQFRSLSERNRHKNTRALAFNGLGWTYYRQALQDEQAGNTDALKQNIVASSNAFRQATQLSPYLDEAWAGLGRAYLLDNRIADAEPVIKKALRLSPSSLTSLLAQSELLLAKNKPDEALTVLYGLKQNTTHESDVFLLLARASLATNRVDDAIINLKQLLEVTPEHTEALKLLSQSYERKMMPEDAEQTLQKAIAINPGDERSVDALLKIYDQRGEPERGILLLKTMLKSRSGQPRYAQQLLYRLERQQRWEDAYIEGINLFPAILASNEVPSPARQELQHLFALAVYWQSKDLLDNHRILNEPAVKSLQTALEQTLSQNPQSKTANLETQRDLLLLSPLNSQARPKANSVLVTTDLPLALQVAYLSGDQSLYNRLLATAQAAENQRIPAARQLADVGDYTGASHLIDAALRSGQAKNPEIQYLREQLTEHQKQIQEHLTSISMLPRKVPDTYFENAASEALRLGAGYWETHATLAKALEKRHAYDLAYIQQKLAAHFAPTEKDRTYWQRKIDKTARTLKIGT